MSARVLVTGGTGFIGSAVVRELRDAGHEVLGLARSERSAAALEAAGAEPIRGDLADPASVRAAAQRADAAIHTAFDNSSVLRMRRSATLERAALAAIADAFAGGAKPLVAVGGFAPVRPRGPVITEDDPVSRHRGLLGRNVELTVMALAGQGANASVVRLPLVHGIGDRFTLARLISLARRHGRSAFPGDGENVLPAVHVSDAARVLRGAMERGRPGSRYDAVAEEGVPFRGVAEAIGRQLALPVVSTRGLRTLAAFGSFTPYVTSNRPASSAITRAELDWSPAGPGLLEDLDRPAYIAAAA